MSTHIVEVVPVAMEPHPNADTLSLVKVFGYTCIVRTADWVGIERAAYLPVDSVVPETPEYAFLGGHRRIKAKRLRGIYSEGLLVPAPADSKVGDDVTAVLGIQFYDPDLFKDSKLSGPAPDTAEDPPGLAPKYTDIENLKRHGHLFTDGEEVIATEKIHGANARFTLRDGVLHVGTHRRWVKEGDSMWWQIARNYELKQKLEALESVGDWKDRGVLYGEVFGQVQDLKYGAKLGELFFVAFDFSVGGAYLHQDDFEAMCKEVSLPIAPVLYRGPFALDVLQELAEQPSSIAGGIREGLVVRPVRERITHFGRVVLKLISERYRLRKEA